MVSEEFKEIVEFAMTDSKFLGLLGCRHHFRTSRLQHCLGVAYVTYQLCQRFEIPPRQATLAALCHDFYLLDWRDGNTSAMRHLLTHPSVALINAMRFIDITATQEDAILNHMWPLARHKPKSKEAWFVCLADKYCSICEWWQAAKEVCREKFLD